MVKRFCYEDESVSLQNANQNNKHMVFLCIVSAYRKTNDSYQAK